MIQIIKNREMTVYMITLYSVGEVRERQMPATGTRMKQPMI